MSDKETYELIEIADKLAEAAGWTLDDVIDLAREYHGRCKTAEQRLLDAIFPPDNFEAMKQADAIWRAACDEQHNRESKRRRANIDNHIRIARKNALIDDWTQEQREATLAHFGNACALTGDTNIHIDHVVAIATGCGGTTLGNMMPLRADLNVSKGAKNIYEWFAENKERYNLSQERFDAAMTYMASLNGLSPEEYREYVYACHEERGK